MKKKFYRVPDMSNIGAQYTPSQKMQAVNKQYGNKNISDQQSTSRQIYHALPADGRTLFEFFKNVGSGTSLAGEIGFPFNNISENKLQVEESLVVRRLYFHVLVMAANVFTSITDFTTAGLPIFYGGDYSLQFDTAIVQKPNPLSSQHVKFSKNSNHTTNEWIWLDNNAVIIPKVQFQWNLTVPVYVATANARIRLVAEGFGSLLSPKGQF